MTMGYALETGHEKPGPFSPALPGRQGPGAWSARASRDSDAAFKARG